MFEKGAITRKLTLHRLFLKNPVIFHLQLTNSPSQQKMSHVHIKMLST